MEPRIAIEPSTAVFDPSFTGSGAPSDEAQARQNKEMLAEAIRDAGGVVAPVSEADGMVWLPEGDPSAIAGVLDANPNIKWVQLPWAGIESFAATGLLERPVIFTSAKAAFAEQVSEHALMLILASLRHLTLQARTPGWLQRGPASLHDRRVTILGGGGIAGDLIKFLNVARCDITVLRRSDDAVKGATRTLPISALHDTLPNTDILVIALALTPETHHIISERELHLLPGHAVVVNVARGGHIATDALVDALKNGRIAAAGLDVTDPEPFPSDHPLWSMDNVLITSHSADSFEYVNEKRAERVHENVSRLAGGQLLVGIVDPTAGY